MRQSGTQLLGEAIQVLKDAGVDDPARDARRLFAYALGVGSDRLTLCLSEPVTEEAQAKFAQVIERRSRREPVSHIIGRRSFFGRDFVVSRDVLDPRPETEILVEIALQRRFNRLLDLGTGSGCILISLLAEMPNARGVGSDISATACSVAARNAEIHGVQDRAEILVSDWDDKIAGKFDLIVSNPPYIALSEMSQLSPEVRDWEPYGALTDGGDGLGAYRAICEAVPPLLIPGGRLMVEVGHRQGRSVADLFRFVGFEKVSIIPDLDSRDRVVMGEMPVAVV